MKTSFDLILPVYRPKPGWELNSAKHLAAIQQTCREADIPLTVYLVNDGSEEKEYFSPAVLDTFRAAVDRFRFLSYMPTGGKGYALRYGVSHSGGDIQIYTDCDFPFGAESILDAYRLLDKGTEVVMGLRPGNYTAGLKPFRRILSLGIRCMNRLLLGLPSRYLDAQAGLKGFRGKGKHAFLMTEINTYLFDTEFILIAWRNHLKIDVVPLQLRENLDFSRMGFKVLFCELCALARIFWNCRIGSSVIRRMEKAVEKEQKP